MGENYLCLCFSLLFNSQVTDACLIFITLKTNATSCLAAINPMLKINHMEQCTYGRQITAPLTATCDFVFGVFLTNVMLGHFKVQAYPCCSPEASGTKGPRVLLFSTVLNLDFPTTPYYTGSPLIQK